MGRRNVYRREEVEERSGGGRKARQGKARQGSVMYVDGGWWRRGQVPSVASWGDRSDKTGGKKRRSDTGTFFLTEEPCTAVVETLTAEIT